MEHTQKELYQGKDGYWTIRGEERRDFTYDKQVKDLKDVVCFPVDSIRTKLITILENYERTS